MERNFLSSSLCQICQDPVDFQRFGRSHIACDQDILWFKAVFINAVCVLCMSSNCVRLGPVRYCKCQQTTLTRIFFFACIPRELVTSPVMQTVGIHGRSSVLPYLECLTTSSPLPFCPICSFAPLAQECRFILSAVSRR